MQLCDVQAIMKLQLSPTSEHKIKTNHLELNELWRHNLQCLNLEYIVISINCKITAISPDSFAGKRTVI